jgi:hypothetical protein
LCNDFILRRRKKLKKPGSSPIKEDRKAGKPGSSPTRENEKAKKTKEFSNQGVRKG